MKSESLLERKRSSSIFKCPFCDKIRDNRVKLSQHVKEAHYKDIECQTDDIEVKIHEPSDKSQSCEKSSKFEEYLCYYCDKMIVSTCDLEKHARSCHEVVRMIEEIQFPCDVCGRSCTSQEQLEEHVATYHYTYYYTAEENLKTCDFCGNPFGPPGGLRNHIRSLHREMLPL